MLNKHDKTDAAPDAADIQRQIEEHEKAIEDLKAKIYVPQTWPKMVYKDLNGNGNFAEAGETRTVIDDKDLKAALAEGWSDHPDKAVTLAAHDQDGEARRRGAKLYVPQTFPKTVYKDLNGDGKFSAAGETRAVNDDAELKKALAEGWSDHPEKAVKIGVKGTK